MKRVAKKQRWLSVLTTETQSIWAPAAAHAFKNWAGTYSAEYIGVSVF